MRIPHFLNNLKTIKQALFFLVCCFLIPISSFGQTSIDIGSNFRTSGKTTNGEFVLCGDVNFINRDTIAAVCAPRIIEDLSAYQGVNRVEIISIGGSGFSMMDADTSPTGLSSTNLTGNIIDPNTTKCINPGSNIYIRYKVYADPVIWGDGNSYNRISTITGDANNGVGPSLSDTRSRATPSMTNANIILGASLTSFQNGTELSSGSPLEVNRDGTYDFTYRVTIGNYNNDANTGDIATNIYYDDRLDGLFNNMPINSISTSPSAFGNLTVNPNYNGNASTVGGVNVIPDDVLVSNGTLNPGQTDYVDITLNVGPIPLTDKGRGRWNNGFLSGEDSAGIIYTAESSDGLDPTQGVTTGPADACANGYIIDFDYAADIEITKIVTNTSTASSGTSGNYDLTYRVFVKADESNDVDIFRLSALDEVANTLGANFVRMVSTPVVTNIDASSAPLGNGSFDGASGSGQGSGIDLLNGGNSNRLEPGQSFFIEYVIEVSSASGNTSFINTVDFSGENSNNTEYVVQAASYSYGIEDNDADGVLNPEDVDDDNDGILDINEVADSIDGIIRYSHNESTNRFNIDLDQPKILDWVLSSADDERYSGDMNVSLVGSELQINNINATSLTEAISNFDYIEYSITTGSDVTELGVFRIYSTIFEDGATNFDRHGDSFKVGVILSTDDWASYQTIADGIEHKDGNGTSTADFFYYHDGYANSPLSWQNNTNYKIRVYFYDYVDDNPTKNYAVFDDFFITFSALREQDTDSDGISDYEDEDSDNDTCVDAIEAGHTDPDNDGILGNSPIRVDFEGKVVGQGGYTGSDTRVTTVNRIISFSSQPSDINVLSGGNAHFNTNISDVGLSYQWEESLDEGATWISLVDGGIYSGATSAFLTITGVTSALDTNDYRLVVTDSENLCISTSTSDSANLTVISNDVSSNDHDNDSIDDSVDLDDDNDGITDANEAQECIDDDYFEWGFNSPVGNRSNDFVQNPAITNWLISASTDVTTGSGLSDASPGSELQISNLDGDNYSQALEGDDYVEVSFTTASGLIDPTIERMGVNWYRNDNGSTVGNAYDAAIAISKDNFATSVLLNSNIRVNYPTDGVSEFFDLTPAGVNYNLEENTTYTVRIYAYNQQSDGNVAYSVFDDFTVRVSACQEQDTDGDGFPNHLDADSDNDSCVDAIEGSHTDQDNDGVLGNSPVSVDGNGLVTGQGGYTGVTGNEIIATEVTLNTTPSDQSVNDGSSASFTVDLTAINTSIFVSGNPDYSNGFDSSSQLQYQWQENGSDLSNGGIYSGTDTNTLLITDVSGLHNNTYTVQVTHLDNECFSSSQSANLNILPNISIDDSSAVEGTNNIFTITSTQAVNQDITFNISYVDNTAVNTDYSGSSTVVLLANSTSASFNVVAVDDALIEPTETYETIISYLSGPSVNITDDIGIGTITDNDGGVGSGITFDNTNVIVDENNGNATFTVRLTGNVPGGFTLDYTTADNTAITVSDYSEISGTLTFLGNDNESFDIVVPITNDNVHELTQDFNVNLTNLSTTLISINDPTATGTINDDDNASIFAKFVAVFENDLVYNLEVELNAAVEHAFTVDFETFGDENAGLGGTATAGTDYAANVSTTFTFPANSPAGTIVTIPITVIDDAIIEPSETIVQILDNISDPTIGILSPNRTFTIQDDDSNAANGISVSDFTVNEAAGTTTFDVSSNVAVQGGFSADFTITDGSALNPNDYTLVSITGTLNFVGIANEIQTVTVTIIDDTLLEVSENLNITLSNISTPLVAMVDDTGVGTITDNDGASASDGISVADFTVDESVGTTNFVITYTGPTVADAFAVDFTVADGTAISPDDYTVTAAIGNVSFPANTTTGTTQVVTVTIIDDSILEASEDLNITLSNITNPLVAMVDADGVGTITDNDGGGAGDGISVADFTVDENVGTTDFVITYTGPTVADAFTVDFVIADGTAISPDDYTAVAATGNVSFPANTTTGTTQVVTVTIIDDAILEASEDLNITLSNITNPLVAMVDADGVGTITDNDGGGAGDGISVADFTVDENAGTTDFVVTYTGPTVADAFTVDFVVIDGTAISPDDYTVGTVTGILNFPANTISGTTQTIEVSIVDDELTETNENLNISLSNITNILVAIVDANGLGVITDNDFVVDIDSDDDGILDSFEDLNTDEDNDPATNPTNSDDDPYPDYLDIDSDNDGIPDNVEAQTTEGYIPPMLQDVNGNGLDDAYEEGGELGLIPVNTDGADLPDYLDLDSDNDTIVDAIEGNDQNHDGIGDVVLIGSDKDNDGLDDSFEGDEQIDIDVNDEVNSPIDDLPNTDGNEEVDYRDIDDDGDGIDTIDEDANDDGNYTNDDFDNDGVPDYLDNDQPIAYEDVEVFNVITPNGDGAHDFLMITGLDIRPDNTINIYNRWGILVYATESYDITNNRFDGTSQARATYKAGELLPTGTYFYVLNYVDVDNSNKSLSGHIYLN